MRHFFHIAFVLPFTILAGDLGDHFFQQKNYYAAITEYKRTLFLDSSQDSSVIIYKMAETYYTWGKLEESGNILTTILDDSTNENLTVRPLALLASIYWDNYDYDALLILLDKLNSVLDEPARSEIEYVRGWTYIYQTDWAEGIRVFESLNESARIPLINDLDKIYELPQKSVFLATVLSSVIPGAGQLYAGNYENFIYAALFIGSIGSSMLWDMYQKAYFTAAVKYLFLFRRYSKGSIYRMQQKIDQQNLAAMSHFLKDVSDRYPKPLDILLKIASSDNISGRIGTQDPRLQYQKTFKVEIGKVVEKDDSLQ